MFGVLLTGIYSLMNEVETMNLEKYDFP